MNKCDEKVTRYGSTKQINMSIIIQFYYFTYLHNVQIPVYGNGLGYTNRYYHDY